MKDMIHILRYGLKKLLLASVALAPLAAGAQTAYEVLNGNNIQARFNADGQLFWDGTGAAFEAPKGSGKNSISAAALWIGGLDQAGDLHLAAQTYRETGSDFWAGPLDNSGETDSKISLEYNRLWKVTRAEVDSFRAGLAIPASITAWPGNGNASQGLLAKMAPFVDMDNDGLYDPAKGDYPDMKGDVMLWWVFNDNLFAHGESQASPLKIEVHASAFAYNCNEDPTLANTVFINYKIVNRSGRQYNNVYAGMWTDLDIGNIFDDYVGSFPALNAYYGYNSGAYDKDTIINTKSGKLIYNGYGNKLPAQSVMFVKGPLNDKGAEMGMSKFIYYNNDVSFTGNPKLPAQYYHYLKGTWTDGSALTKGGLGYNGTENTNYAFPGMPGDKTDWNEISAKNAAGDRRGLGTFGPLTLQANASIDFTVAFTYHISDNGNTLNSIRLMENQLADLQKNYRSGALSPCQALAVCAGNNCVYPGDADNNGKAHMTDLFMLGLGYGETGPARPFASSSWAPQGATEWGKKFPNGLDYKYADANGDGVIDSLDVLPILLNYTKTHSKDGAALGATSADPVLAIHIDQDSVTAGGELSGEITLGTAEIPAENVLGLTFSLVFDPDYFDPGSIKFDLSQGTLGDIKDILDMYKQAADGKIDIGLVRKTKTGKQLDNIVIKWRIVVEGNIAGIHQEAFTIQDQVVISPQMTIITVRTQGDDVAIIPSTSGIAPKRFDDLSDKVTLYPNPAQDRLNLDLGNLKINSIRVFTLQGRQVLNINRQAGGQIMAIDVRSIPQGMYFAEIITPTGRAIKKFNITR